MAAGVAFLQSDVDEAHKTVGSYKPGNTDVIRQMLREQQRSMGALHANALFREFRGDRDRKKFGKGYAPPQADMPTFDDFQAEGQTRLAELIEQTATRDNVEQRGVWAAFGKAYVCRGTPEEPQSKLPALNRDEIANMEKAKKGAGARQKKPAPAAPGTSSGPAPPSGGQGAPGQQQEPPGTAGSQRGASRGGSRGGSARRIGTAASLASMESSMKPEEALEFKLNKIKTVMRFTANDMAEVQFPSGPIKQAELRRKRVQARPGSFVDPDVASQEVTDPFVAYGQPLIPQRVLKPTTKPAEKGSSDHKSSVFVTQGVGMSVPEIEAETQSSHRRSFFGGGAGGRRSSIGFQDKGLGDFDGGGARPLDDGDSDAGLNGPQGAQAVSGPAFHPLVHEAAPMRGDEDNPVYSWHNNFLRARQHGRAALQAALYERAEGRFRARTVGPMAANLSSILMADLDVVRGKQVPYATLGLVPESPYVKMDHSWAVLQQRAAHAARAAQQLDPEELRVLQRFYDQLCALVEAQRMSDPLSLMVVHKVKSLLEEGTFLQRVMFEAVVGHLGKFCSSTGVCKYNKYLLSIFTFIAKCTGVNELDFETLVHDAGLSQVVFNTPLPPSAMAAQASASPTNGLEDSNPTSPTRRGAASKAGTKGSTQRPPKRLSSKLGPAAVPGSSGTSSEQAARQGSEQLDVAGVPRSSLRTVEESAMPASGGPAQDTDLV